MSVKPSAENIHSELLSKIISRSKWVLNDQPIPVLFNIQSHNKVLTMLLQIMILSNTLLGTYSQAFYSNEIQNNEPVQLESILGNGI